VRSYLDTLRHWRFALLWGGLTVSSLGDSITRLSLVWLVYHLRGSAADVGLLVTAYSIPIVLGGPLAGVILDRMGPRRSMLADNLIRGIIIGLIPVLFHLGALHPWHLYAVAATYGLMRMITLAGAPTMLPLLLPAAQLNAANALETISFSISDFAGLPLAGLLLSIIDGADVLIFDALSYFFLVSCLLSIGPVAGHRAPTSEQRATDLKPAIQFSLANQFIRNSTLMYMLLNVGRGVLEVLVPVYVLQTPGANSRTLGLVSAGAAVGGLGGSVFSGLVGPGVSYPRLIARSLSLNGLPLLAFAARLPWYGLAFALAVSSAIEAPLTAWAQTERMRLVPEGLRGRVFALLRTVMQSGPALGGLLGAQVVGTLPRPATVGIIVVLMSGPGLLALLAPWILESTPPA
jgi:MFS family permease